MPRSNSTVVLLVLVLSVWTATPAQESAPKPSPSDASREKEQEQRKELEKKTIALLNDTASAAWSLKLPENRFFVMTNAGNLLWPSDEKRARTLYWEALNSINLIAASIRVANTEGSKADAEKALQAYVPIAALRQKLVREVAVRDAQLALDMLRATRQLPSRPAGYEGVFPDDRQLEQDIMAQVTARDPAQALQAARDSLAKGLSYEVLNLLHRLNQKDSEKASQFAGEIISKLQSTNVAADSRASSIALHLLLNSRSSQGARGVLVNVQSGAEITQLKLSDEQKRQLVDVVTSATLTVSANANLLYSITDIMPEIEQFYPERRAPLERKLALFNDTLNKQQQAGMAYRELIRRGVPEEILRAAATASDENRQSLYQQAAVVAAARGNTESFRELLEKEIKDEAERQKVLDSLDNEEIGFTAYRKQIDELKKLIPKIRRKEQRARAMAELALLLKEKGEDSEASSLLDEAATLIKTDLNSETQTDALLTLLGAYAVVDPPKAFALAERTVDHANSQVSMLLLLDRVVKSGAVKKGEIVLENSGIMPFDFLVFKYGKGVAALAKADFNRTRALADRFDRAELRLMARLMIIRGVFRELRTYPHQF